MDSIQGSLTQGSGLAFLAVVRGRKVATKLRDRASSRPFSSPSYVAPKLHFPFFDKPHLHMCDVHGPRQPLLVLSDCSNQRVVRGSEICANRVQ